MQESYFRSFENKYFGVLVVFFAAYVNVGDDNIVVVAGIRWITGAGL